MFRGDAPQQGSGLALDGGDQRCATFFEGRSFADKHEAAAYQGSQENAGNQSQAKLYDLMFIPA